MSSVTAAGTRPLSAHHAVVLYDAEGRIVHVHHILAVEGSDAPDAAERERIARDGARQAGAETEGLSALETAGSAFERGHTYRVDVEAGELRAEPAPAGRRRGR